MTRFDLLDEMVSEGNGYLRTADVVARGVSKPTLAEFVHARNMERVAHGIYLAEDSWEDDLFQLAASNSRIIYSHETALHLHGLMEREPKNISATVMTGYNASHLRQKGVRIYQVQRSIYALGLSEESTTWGHTVPVYDMERTICDIIRYKNEMDIQIFQHAMKEYMASNRKKLNHLMQFARLLHVEDKVKIYTEVML